MTMPHGTVGRALALAGAFLLVAFVIRNDGAQAAPRETSLRAFPVRIGSWAGTPAPALDQRVVEVLGADDYLLRIYEQEQSVPVDLFVGYYASQKSGSVIHSPRNCLPGAGWQPVDWRRLQLNVVDPHGSTPGRRVEINEVVVQQVDERRMALYWYQERGRIVASEYMSRVYMVLDGMRYGRTDGALVRVMTPIGVEPGREAAARDRLTGFVRAIFPTLDRYLPA